MRIRLTVEVPDEVRAVIAQLYPDWPRTKARLATRLAVARFIDQKMTHLEDASIDWIVPTPLTEGEKRDAAAAADYLRKAGRTEEQIRAWILLQRARANFT